MIWIRNLVPVLGAFVGVIIFLWIVTEGMFEDKKDNKKK